MPLSTNLFRLEFSIQQDAGFMGAASVGGVKPFARKKKLNFFLVQHFSKFQFFFNFSNLHESKCNTFINYLRFDLFATAPRVRGPLLFAHFDSTFQNRLNRKKNQISDFYFSSYGHFCTPIYPNFHPQLEKYKLENFFIIFPILYSTLSIIHENRIKTEGGGRGCAYP